MALYKPTRSVKITCSTHTPGGCSLNFAQPVAGRSFSDMPWRVPGFKLEAWAFRGRCHREVATLWLQMFELVGSEIANDADPRLAGEAATCPRTSGPCARCRPLDLRIIGQLICGCALVPLATMGCQGDQRPCRGAARGTLHSGEGCRCALASFSPLRP